MLWKFSIYIMLILSAQLTFIGCQKPQTNPGSSIGKNVQPLVTLTGGQQKQKELAIAAKEKLFQSLLGELTESMGENGPGKSISVCKTRAPEIAAAIGKETGVRIGRTSIKLRNPGNRPPDWAVSFVTNQIENEVEVELPENGLGVLLPIRLKATCTLCHGTDDQVMPEVRAAIATDYPEDQATGFAEGDLRGYFWVEVPKLQD